MSTLSQLALGGSRRIGNAGSNFLGGIRPRKLMGSINRNARRVGVLARYASNIANIANQASNGALERNPTFRKGTSLLTTVGGLARDRDMTNPKYDPVPRDVSRYLGY